MSDEQPTEKLPGTDPSETQFGRSPERLFPPSPFQQYPEEPRDPDPSQPTPLYSPPPSSPLRSPTPSSPLSGPAPSSPFHNPTPSAPLYYPPEPYAAYQPVPNLQAQHDLLLKPRSRNRTTAGILATIGCAVLALVIIGVLWFPGAIGHVSGNVGSQSTDTSAPAGTSGSGQTSTSRSGTGGIFAPVLGGTVNDFTQQFGDPVDPVNNEAGVWRQVTIAGQSVTLMVSTASPGDSQDGELHVMNVILETSPNATWSSSTQQQIMAAFLPSDAKFEKQVSTDSGNERLYTSAQLASTFKTSLFINQATSQTVAPGTFDEQCYLGGNSVQAGGAANTCSITLGIVS